MKRFIVEVEDYVGESSFKNEVTTEHLSIALYDHDEMLNVRNISEVKETWETANGKPRMTTAQRDKLWSLCGSYNVPFREDDYHPTIFSSSSPTMYEGWVGGFELKSVDPAVPRTIYVGVEPNGDSHS